MITRDKKGERECVLLCIVLCKHSLKSTEVNLTIHAYISITAMVTAAFETLVSIE